MESYKLTHAAGNEYVTHFMQPNMEPFRKTIHGIDFNFELSGDEREYFYKVTADNLYFELHIDDDAVWQIHCEVPQWIKELEEDLRREVELHEL